MGSSVNALLNQAIQILIRSLLHYKNIVQLRLIQNYAHLQLELYDGCTVAILPPVSGG